MLSVEQVAEILKLHVRTIRNYVRSGTLKATRIGKQYRIALGDLEAFTGQPVANHDERILAPGGRVEVSGVISVAGVTPALAMRLTNTLMATAKGPAGAQRALGDFDHLRGGARSLAHTHGRGPADHAQHAGADRGRCSSGPLPPRAPRTEYRRRNRARCWWPARR